MSYDGGRSWERSSPFASLRAGAASLFDPRLVVTEEGEVHLLALRTQRGTTVLLTTQYLEEAGELADRIVIINDGTIIADGRPGELQASLGSGILRIRLQHAQQRASAEAIVLDTLGTAAQVEPEPGLLSAKMTEPALAEATITALQQSGITVTEFSLGQPSLDEVFLALTALRAPEETKEEVA